MRADAPRALLACLLVPAVSACGGDGAGPTDPDPGTPPEAATGSMEVAASTSGSDLDPDGYTVAVDGEDVSVDPNGTAAFDGLEAGSHDVGMSGVRANCSVEGDNPRSVDVEAGATSATTFEVACRSAVIDEIVYTSTRNDPNGDVYVQAADGLAFTRLTTDTVAERWPAVSPDGTLIAFGRDSDPGPGLNEDIIVMNADGSDPTPLAPHPERDRYPAWSPDGSQIVFDTRRDGDREVYRMTVDGTELVNLTRHDSTDGVPDWSPDGERVLFTSDRDGNAEVYVMSAEDGSGLENLTRHDASDGQARWSPEGSRIVFASTRDDPTDSDILLMDADGSNVQNLTESPGEGELDPVWSPDGSRIAYTTDRDGDFEVVVMVLETGETTTLTDNTDLDRWPSWSPVR